MIKKSVHHPMVTVKPDPNGGFQLTSVSSPFNKGNTNNNNSISPQQTNNLEVNGQQQQQQSSPRVNQNNKSIDA
jgi:hypothetical protein